MITNGHAKATSPHWACTYEPSFRSRSGPSVLAPCCLIDLFTLCRESETNQTKPVTANHRATLQQADENSRKEFWQKTCRTKKRSAVPLKQIQPGITPADTVHGKGWGVHSEQMIDVPMRYDLFCSKPLLPSGHKPAESNRMRATLFAKHGGSHAGP